MAEQCRIRISAVNAGIKESISLFLFTTFLKYGIAEFGNQKK